MKLVSQTVTDFVAETASSSPAPGGGSISALAGTLSAALAQMVIRLTEGKKAFLALPENIQTEITGALSILETKHRELLALIDEATEAFNSFMAALAFPKATDEEKANSFAQFSIENCTFLLRCFKALESACITWQQKCDFGYRCCSLDGRRWTERSSFQR